MGLAKRMAEQREQRRRDRQRRQTEVERRLRWAFPRGVTLQELADRLNWPGQGYGLVGVLRELAEEARAHVRDDGRWYLGPAPEAREKGCEGGASDASPGGSAALEPGTPQEPDSADLPAGESGAGSGGLAPEPEGPRAEEQDEGHRAIAAVGQQGLLPHPRGRQDEDPSLPTPAPAPVPVQQAGEEPAATPPPPVERRPPPGDPSEPQLRAGDGVSRQSRAETVLEDLRTHPGSRPREVVHRTGLPKGTVSSVLHTLSSQGRVVRVAGCYSVGPPAEPGPQPLGPVRWDVLAYLRAHPDGVTTEEVWRHLGASRAQSTVRTHLGRLAHAGLAVATGTARSRRWYAVVHRPGEAAETAEATPRPPTPPACEQGPEPAPLEEHLAATLDRLGVPRLGDPTHRLVWLEGAVTALTHGRGLAVKEVSWGANAT